MKPMVNIWGDFSYEPQVGFRAFIRKSNGETLYTSQVVDVRNKTENGVEIETQNTIYRVTFNHDSLPIAG